MMDVETESLWGQVRGESIQGKMEKKRLNLFNSAHTTYSKFKEMFPEGKLLVKPEKGEDIGIDVIMPWELVPIPAKPLEDKDVRGLARVRYVPLDWVKQLASTPQHNAQVYKEMDKITIPISSMPSESGSETSSRIFRRVSRRRRHPRACRDSRLYRSCRNILPSARRPHTDSPRRLWSSPRCSCWSHRSDSPVSWRPDNCVCLRW